MTGGAVTHAPIDCRSSGSFGGIVPSAAIERDGSALVMALAVEHHADGAAIPLLILSDAPGLLAWEPLDDTTVVDDRDRRYAVSILHGQAGLGALQVSLWIDPPPPPDTRYLRVCVPTLHRLAPARGGSGITRQLPGGPWELLVDLVPPRTTATVPPHPGSGPADAELSGRVPSRTLGAFVDLLPVGQARISSGAAVCLWGIERYKDLALLTVSLLGNDPEEIPGEGIGIEVWDDRGTEYDAVLEQAGSLENWSEIVVRVAPRLDPAATRLGVRVGLHADSAGSAQFLFGIALPGRR